MEHDELAKKFVQKLTALKEGIAEFEQIVEIGEVDKLLNNSKVFDAIRKIAQLSSSLLKLSKASLLQESFSQTNSSLELTCLDHGDC